MSSVVALRRLIMSKEQLNFKITLSGTYWDKKPEYDILLNETVMAHGFADNNNVIEFTADLEEDIKHTLCVRLLNKEDSDTVQNEDKTEIVKDMLLNIEQIYLDDISLGTLKWTHSKYVANGKTYENCVNLGWNGDWILQFESPFYIWLLENT